jgi:hypothetical protein
MHESDSSVPVDCFEGSRRNCWKKKELKTRQHIKAQAEAIKMILLLCCQPSKKIFIGFLGFD